MSAFESFRAKIESLQQGKQLIFCCGLCEHILPFFDHLRGVAAPRDLLNLLWAVAAGDSVDGARLTEVSKLISEAMPNASEEDDICSEIAMRSSVAVLETLDVLRGTTGAAVRAGCAPLEVLQLVQLLTDEPVHPDYELFEIVDNPSISPQAIYREWNELNVMLDGLSAQEFHIEAWRRTQAERGHELLNAYRHRLNC